jgi:hypothetical protein
MLDHGLYIQLGEKFRRDYCRLWQALILGDTVGIEKHCKALNAGDAYKLLASMIMLRSWDDVTSKEIDKKRYFCLELRLLLIMQSDVAKNIDFMRAKY